MRTRWERGRRPQRGEPRHRWRPRHRTADTGDEPADTAAEDSAPAKRALMAGISTSALVIAATGLLGLGMLARWVSNTEQAEPARAIATAEAPSADAAGPTTPGRTTGSRNDVSRGLVVVPDSNCRRFIQTRQDFPTLTISVENSCH